MAAEKRKESMICINCPKGCRMDAVYTDDEWKINGNDCIRGEDYARQELTDPRRILTALMRPEGSDKPVSVKTDRTVPRARLLECAAALYRVHPKLPIKAGDVLIDDLCGTGARVIATRNAG